MDDNNSSIKRSKEEEKQEEEKAEQDKHSVKDSDRKEGSEKSSLYKMLSVIKSLGPGLIAGAADEDPSTIGTYSQAGAQFGLGMLWLALFQYPLIAAVQEMCARIGLVTGSGLAAVIKKKYSRKVVLTVSSLILIANAINIGADIGAMADISQTLSSTIACCYCYSFFYSVHRSFPNVCPISLLCKDIEISYHIPVRICCNSCNCWR